MDDKIFVSFIGPSGSGKSTCRQFAEKYLRERGYDVYHVDVAAPLRQIQTYAYELFTKKSQDATALDYKQDGRLLQFLAEHFEDRLGPTFKASIKEILDYCPSKKIAIINTDCRNNAYKTLKELGFVFIRLTVPPILLAVRQMARGDLTKSDHHSSVEQYDTIEYSHEIDNVGSLDDLEKNVYQVLDLVCNEKEN